MVEAEPELDLVPGAGPRGPGKLHWVSDEPARGEPASSLPTDDPVRRVSAWTSVIWAVTYMAY